MSSIVSVMSQLTSGFISETYIINYYLQYPDVIKAIETYRWQIGSTDNQGWTHLFKIVNYSS
jgi:hypothetical protein